MRYETKPRFLSLALELRAVPLREGTYQGELVTGMEMRTLILSGSVRKGRRTLRTTFGMMNVE